MKNFLIAKQNDNGTWDVESYQTIGGRAVTLRIPCAEIEIKPFAVADSVNDTIWTLTVPDAVE